EIVVPVLRPSRIVILVQQRRRADRRDGTRRRIPFERHRDVDLAGVERGIEINRRRVAECDIAGEVRKHGSTCSAWCVSDSSRWVQHEATRCEDARYRLTNLVV